MEKFLNQTKGFLGVIQSILSEEELKNSTAAAEKMYEEIAKVVKDKDLNIRECIHAIMAVNTTILELTLEQMKDEDEKGDVE